MLKYDDLFYPNRGKKNVRQLQQNGATVCHGHDCEHQNNDALLAPLLTSPHWPSSIVQLEQLQQQQQLEQQKWLEKLSAIYNNDNYGLQQDMSSMYKMNVYDQSVKPSMPSAMAAKKISAAIKNAMLLPQQHNERTQQQKQKLLQHMLMMIARNVADGDDAANRLQHLTTAKTTRSMSTAQKTDMKQEPYYEIQQEQSKPDHQQQKSLTNFELPMLWRHLQLLKQKALTMQQPELPTHQHFDYTRQLQLQKKLHYPDSEADTDTDTHEAQLAQTYP